MASSPPSRDTAALRDRIQVLFDHSGLMQQTIINVPDRQS